MKRSDISDAQVVESCLDYHDALTVWSKARAEGGTPSTPKISIERLMALVDAPEKLARAAMKRAYSRGLLECGLGIDWAWPTDQGLELISEERREASAALDRELAA